jgi:transposase
VGVFKRYDDVNQGLLFPPSPRDWLPDDHLAWFVSDTVDQLDLDAFIESYRACGKGEQAYPPAVMLKILLYAYSVGIFSSRKIAAGLHTDVPLRVLGGGLFPDFRTICRFRNVHKKALSKVFVQLVQIAKDAGLVKLGTLAIDGSKIKANASKHRAMSYERMQQEENRLLRQIQKIVAAAKRKDVLEDEEFGPDFRGDELPAELSRRETRLATIKAAKKRLEERKALEAQQKDEARAQEASEEGRDPPRERPEQRKHPKGKPKPKDQENFTDPDSRIMCMASGHFEQSYNAQIAVDEKAQIIVGTRVSQIAPDAQHLMPMLEEVEHNTKEQPRRVIADAGYRSEAVFRHLRERGVDGYVAVGREGKDTSRSALPETRAMQRKLRSKRGRKIYKKRKHVVEPVLGWIKSVIGFRQFSLRGLEKVNAEWTLVCAATNLRRMAARLSWV